MLYFWCDYVEKTQIRGPSSRKIIFFEQEIKNRTSINRVSIQKGKWPSWLGKRIGMYSCSIGAPSPYTECILPQSIPTPRHYVDTLVRKPLLEGRRVGRAGVRSWVSAFKPPH